MTDAEIEAEKRYRREERIGIWLACISNPTADDLKRAANAGDEDAAEWERIYRESPQKELF